MDGKKTFMSIDDARFLYNTCDDVAKEIILKYFGKDELEMSFNTIRTFKDACDALKLDYSNMEAEAERIGYVSKASAAMFKVNIVRKALNWGHDLHLTKDSEDSCVYYPYNPVTTKNCDLYDDELDLAEMEIIGEVKNEGEIYNILGGAAYRSGGNGLSLFRSDLGVGSANDIVGFLGCANKEIAKHFSKYFGMLITKAKFGDLDDIDFIYEKY